MSTWSPLRALQPAEWLLVPSRLTGHVAIIRRFRFGGEGGEEWFRAVTWHETSERRELIGWARTLEVASQAAWDWWCAAEQWRHDRVGKRRHGTPAVRPSAGELLAAYREQQSRSEETGVVPGMLGAPPPAGVVRPSAGPG